MRACGSGLPRGAHDAGGSDRQADARAGDTRSAVHQIVKADKGGVPDRRTRGGADARQRGGAVEAAARDAAMAGRVTQAMSVKACISMFRQMMFASGSGMHRKLCARQRVCRRARACLSVDEKTGGRSRAAPVHSVRFACG
ncbi:hypothetical protein B7G54_22250 [Burkholderia puraquae]|uniref:Uncharacterized protein n=1 Tax=Burkholderia puraquae TaxID=1904757 RepID=A0A1X1PCY0_9BURK|nr:hypothetical protein B7G54_22250 [Burkholderia puraquae]